MNPASKLVHLLADRVPLELVEAPQALLDRLGVRQDIKGVLGDLPQDARHVRGAPCEDVSVGAEEVDKHHFPWYSPSILFHIMSSLEFFPPPCCHHTRVINH